MFCLYIIHLLYTLTTKQTQILLIVCLYSIPFLLSTVVLSSSSTLLNVAARPVRLYLNNTQTNIFSATIGLPSRWSNQQLTEPSSRSRRKIHKRRCSFDFFSFYSSFFCFFFRVITILLLVWRLGKNGKRILLRLLCFILSVLQSTLTICACVCVCIG